MDKINILLDVEEDFLPKAKYVFRTIFKILGWKISCFTRQGSEDIHIYYGKKTEKVFPLKIYYEPETAAFFKRKERYPDDKFDFFRYRGEYIPFLFSQKGEIFRILPEQTFLRKDIVASAFYFLSCWQEYVVSAAENFAEKDAVQVKFGFAEQPPLDRYCRVLDELLLVSLNEYNSHSVWQNDKSFVVPISVETRKNLLPDGHIFHKLFSLEKAQKIKPSHFVEIGIDTDNLQPENNLKQRLMEIFKDRKLSLLGAEETAFHLDLLRMEQSVLEEFSAAGFRTEKFDYQVLFSLLEKLNFKFDASVSFQNRIGFRAGTSFPFQPYNFKENRPFSVLEIPVGINANALFIQFKTNPKKIPKKLKTMINYATKHNSALAVSFDIENLMKNKKEKKIFFLFLEYVRKHNGWLSTMEDFAELWQSR